MRSIERMMLELAPQSAHSAATIKDVYRQHMGLLVLSEYAALEGQLATGGVVPLPPDPLRFNIRPRVEGLFPIGEKDLANQDSYISARAATIGALLEIAARVPSGPVEVTSLVRHSEYQGALRVTNSNATTDVPTHTMGLAVDIALVNTPLKTVYQIRDVLNEMQAAGDILFIGERRQLVFHVVPHPSRLGHFSAVYENAIASTIPGANVVAAWPLESVMEPELVPAVSADVIQIRPTEEFAQEWWAADHVPTDLVVAVSPPFVSMPEPHEPSSAFDRVAARWSLVVEVLRAAWNSLT